MIADPEPTNCDSDRLAVDAENVHKQYQRGTTRTPVLQGVDLAVERGQCVYLAGPSGSGKTTLLSILGCILTADQGQVRLFGQDIGTLDQTGRIALRRNRIGFVFQRFHLIRGLKALDNVCVPLVLKGVKPKAVHRRGMALLQAVGLTDKAHEHPRNLSAGQCQRVALARALVGDPDLVLADEPTASLDAENGQEVMGLLRRLTTEEGKTAVVVTHDPRIFQFADRVFRLQNGRILGAEGTQDSSSQMPATSSQVVSTDGDSQ